MPKDINQRLIDAMFEIAHLEKNEEAIEFLYSQYPEHSQSIANESLYSNMLEGFKEIAQMKGKSDLESHIGDLISNSATSVVVESLDQMRSKALKMKETSSAFAILYGYNVKGKEVELEPEEFATEKEYKDRISQITNSLTKLSDKDPRGNRYGHERNIIFYTLYPDRKTINENTTIEKWDMGSDKSNLTQEELDLLERLAQKLEVNSPNGYKYVIQQTYEDYGAGMKWWNIICYDKRGNSWQVLNTKEWLDLMNTGDVDKVYQDVVNGDYFQDKQKDIKDMNMGELFNHMED